MPLSATDSIFLQSHGFCNLYAKYRNRLLIIAKGIYQRMKNKSGISPDPLSCEWMLEFALINSTVFADIITDLCLQISLGLRTRFGLNSSPVRLPDS
jgi:hypothetical protein